MQVKQSVSSHGVMQLNVTLDPHEQFSPSALAAHIPPQTLVYLAEEPTLASQFLELTINNDRQHIIEVHLALSQQDKTQLFRSDYFNTDFDFAADVMPRIRRTVAGSDQRPAGKNLLIERDVPRHHAGHISVQRLSANREQINGEDAIIYHSYAFDGSCHNKTPSTLRSGDLLKKARYMGTVAAVAIKNSQGQKGAAAFAEVDPDEIEQARAAGGILAGRDILTPADPTAKYDDLIQAHGIRGDNDIPLPVQNGKSIPLVRGVPDGFLAEIRPALLQQEIIRPYAFFSVQAIYGGKHIMMSRVMKKPLDAATSDNTSRDIKSRIKNIFNRNDQATNDQATVVRDAIAGANAKGGHINNTNLSKLEEFDPKQLKEKPISIALRGHFDYQAAIHQALSYRGPSGNRMASLFVSDKGLTMNDIFNWYAATDRFKSRSSVIDPSCKGNPGDPQSRDVTWNMRERNLPRSKAKMWQGNVGSTDSWWEIEDKKEIARVIKELGLPDK